MRQKALVKIFMFWTIFASLIVIVQNMDFIKEKFATYGNSNMTVIQNDLMKEYHSQQKQLKIQMARFDDKNTRSGLINYQGMKSNPKNINKRKWLSMKQRSNNEYMNQIRIISELKKRSDYQKTLLKDLTELN